MVMSVSKIDKFNEYLPKICSFIDSDEHVTIMTAKK